MSTLRTVKKLVLGETWIVPLGVAAALAAGALLGGVALIAGVVAVLVVGVQRTARRR